MSVDVKSVLTPSRKFTAVITASMNESGLTSLTPTHSIKAELNALARNRYEPSEITRSAN